MKFDPTKPCQFRDPSKGEVLKFLYDAREYGPLEKFPLCFLVRYGNGRRIVRRNADGTAMRDEREWDIINAPQRVKRWVNVYERETDVSIGVIYLTQEEARENRSANVVATVPIEFEVP